MFWRRKDQFKVNTCVGCHCDGAWWRHEAPSAAEMMEEAWKSGRQVCRLLLAMDR